MAIYLFNIYFFAPLYIIRVYYLLQTNPANPGEMRRFSVVVRLQRSALNARDTHFIIRRRNRQTERLSSIRVNEVNESIGNLNAVRALPAQTFTSFITKDRPVVHSRY